MSLLRRLTPTNLLAEKDKFMTDHSYNPQFTYQNPVDDQTLYQYGRPHSRHLDLALTILDKVYYHRTETDLKQKKGPQVPQQEVTHKIKQFLDMHGLKERFKIVWSSSFVARTAITADTIKLRLPVNFREQGLIGMLYHEIGTHALRRINYEQQPWYRKKKEFGFSNYLKTEEGLAILHSLLPLDFQLAYKPALNYVSGSYAQKHSFAQLWEFLTKYIDDSERRFIFTLRKKRGLTDTSQPGGFTKDLTYFEGLVNTWQYLKDHNFDPTLLYFGKLALEDVPKAVQMSPSFKPILPSFYLVDKVLYKHQLDQIGLVNLLK